MVALTTVFRQLGDDRMTAILNEIREGLLVGHAQEQLNARTDPDFVPPDDEFWLTAGADESTGDRPQPSAAGAVGGRGNRASRPPDR